MGLNWCRNSWQRIGGGKSCVKDRIAGGWWGGEGRSVLWWDSTLMR